MTKKHFIEVANLIAEHNRVAAKHASLGIADSLVPFDAGQLETLCDAFKRCNGQFSRERWLAYVAGECGPNGGKR